LARRKERSGYRNLILTISQRKERNAETPKHDHPCHAHAFGRVRRPRMSRFGGKATGIVLGEAAGGADQFTYA
jgi:hypothetical protein